MFLIDLCNSFHENNVDYALVGGHAVALHGAVRGTLDIDFILRWTPQNLENAEKALNELGLISRQPLLASEIYSFREEYIQKRNLHAWNFFDPDDPTHQVDIIITADLKDKKVRKVKTIHGSIALLEIDDLVDMKKQCGREQDIEDVKALEKLK